MLFNNHKYNLRRSSISAFLAATVLIVLFSLLIVYNLKAQENMLRASGVSYEIRILLERCSEQINLLLDRDSNQELPERVVVKLRDDLVRNTKTLAVRKMTLRELLLGSSSAESFTFQTLDGEKRNQATVKLDEIDRLWAKFDVRIKKISTADIAMLKAGNRYWNPVDMLVAHNGMLFKNMYELNELVYQASLNQHLELRTLYAIIVGLVVTGFWLIWFATLRPLAKRLEDSYRKIVQQNECLDFQANHDGMTKLLNRAAFNRKLDELGDNLNGLSQCCLILIDLDEFKSINDNLGHQTGDEILKKVSGHMLEDCLLGEFSYRIGGDEFAILIECIEDQQQLISRLDKLMARIREPLQFESQKVYASCSLGVSWGEGSGDTLEEIFSAADAALYKVKESGRNHYCFFHEISHVSASQLLRSDQELHRAVQKKEFVVHYQPIIDLRTNELHSFEALARWQHPERGLLLPEEWLSRAEKLNLDSVISRQIIEAVASDYRKWQQADIRCHPVTINITEKMLVSGEGLGVLQSILSRFSDKSWLGIEVTESVVFDRAFHIIKRQLELIHAAGIQIVLDDFGTGFANLSHLRRIPFDAIKLDKCFTSQILTDSGMKIIVESLITLSKGLNKMVICEGVDETGIRVALEEMGCHYSQGFLHGKAVPFSAVSELLRPQREIA